MRTIDEGSDIDMSVQDTPPQKKEIKLEVFDKEMASPGNRSDISSSSSNSVGSIELPPFTLTVKYALRDGDCNSNNLEYSKHLPNMHALFFFLTI